MISINLAVLQKDIKKTLTVLRKLPPEFQGKAIKEALAKAAQPLIQQAKANTPRADKPIIRYLNGKPIAVYYPGNLQRSIGVLKLKKTIDSVFIGPRVSTSGTKGVFRGNRYDPYYAHIVHNGSVNQSANPYLLNAFISTRNIVIQNVAIQAALILKKYAQKNRV